MSTKYSKLPQEDPESVGALDFNSIFTYDYPKHFSYGEHSKKFRSAFTYTGGLDMKFKKQVLGMQEKYIVLQNYIDLIKYNCT